MDNSSYKTATPTADQDSSSPSLRDSRKQKKVKKYPSFIRKISDEWGHFMEKIRQISDLNFTDEEFLDSLFDTTDDEIFLHGKSRATPSLTPAEQQFLLDYKKYNLLEKVAEQEKNGEKMETTVPLTSSYASSESAPQSVMQHTDIFGNSVENEIAEDNPGQVLWEQRRQQWLTPSSEVDTDEKRNARIAQSSMKHVSRNLYPRIYKEFIDKSKPLKKGKAINLEDFIAIMNAGWTAEKRWERAAKGLP